MAILEKIVVQDFRNISLQELEFSPNINCISGNNGEGKTNLMEAVWYLSMTKSAFSTPEKYNIRYGCDSFSIAGTYKMPQGLVSRFSIKVDANGEKKIKKDDKQYPKVSEHIGQLPIVMVSPSDTSLVSESGEERRRFANAVLSQMDISYLTAAQQYNRLLAQRNKMLKDERLDPDLLSIIDMRMGQSADVIYRARERFAKELQPVVSEYYKTLSGGSEEVSIEYKSDLNNATMEEVLAAHLQKDKILRYTSAGIHRDDFVFTMNGHPIRRCGSQGQQKSFLVSLKFAQYDIMKKSYGYAPILLLDDVFDKLDMNRISNLLSMVAGDEFGQIFITDSNKVRMAGIVDAITKDSAFFETVGGSFKRL
ncbi:MAG: DNA replication and repair protein RecF [Bacteroidales bacterium]|nr:DNA replication and repair protein RecF [Bacteroidales bacterium]